MCASICLCFVWGENNSKRLTSGVKALKVKIVPEKELECCVSKEKVRNNGLIKQICLFNQLNERGSKSAREKSFENLTRKTAAE